MTPQYDTINARKKKDILDSMEVTKEESVPKELSDLYHKIKSMRYSDEELDLIGRQVDVLLDDRKVRIEAAVEKRKGGKFL